MKTPKHTPEPWETTGEICPVTHSVSIYHWGPIIYIYDNTNGPENQIANARRIVECVNACAGIEDPVKWIADHRKQV